MMYLGWITLVAIATYLSNDWLEGKNNPNRFLSKDQQQPVVLQQNAQGHYIATGMINNVEVVFLLDTGATNVVIGEKLAKKLRLKKQNKVRVSTANGVVSNYRTRLASVSLGGLQANNIKALINPHASDEMVLLGMSFLKHLRLSQHQNTLTLSAP